MRVEKMMAAQERKIKLAGLGEFSCPFVHVDAQTFVKCDRCGRMLDVVIVMRVLTPGSWPKMQFYGTTCYAKAKVQGTVLETYEMVHPVDAPTQVIDPETGAVMQVDREAA